MFSAIKETTEEAYSEIGQLVTYLLVGHKERAKALLGLLPMDKQAIVQQVLNLNVEDIPSKFRFRVQTADVEQSEDARRQSKLTLVQLYTMYGKEIFQIVPMIYNEQVPPPIKEIATKFFIGATKLMDDIFQAFGTRETDDYLPYIRDVEMMVQAIEAQKDMKIQGGGGGRGISQASAQMETRTVAAGSAEGPYGGSGGPTAGRPPQASPGGGELEAEGI